VGYFVVMAGKQGQKAQQAKASNKNKEDPSLLSLFLVF
jgi:hypothetical protein